MRSECELHEIDLNECEYFFKVNLNGSEIDLNKSNLDQF